MSRAKVLGFAGDVGFKPLPINRQFHDLIGRKFGRLTVQGYAGITGDRKPQHSWFCLCECGNRHVAMGVNIVSGNTKSCGCLHSEKNATAHFKHGQGKAGSLRGREYIAYHGMMSRCHNPTNIGFRLYGGRGIKVCDRWRLGDGRKSGFECFLADMGKKPSKRHSLDRKNNDGMYEPSNARWALPAEQAANTRRNRWVVWEGKKMIVAEALRLSGVHKGTFYKRLRHGWTQEAALKGAGSPSPQAN